jgi:HUS1 checkpoint protein
MHIICAPSHGGGATALGGDAGLQVWSQIKTSSLFTEYRIQSNANNEISLVLSTEALASALRSVAGGAAGGGAPGQMGMHSFEGPEVTLRLAKKHDTAVLSFEMTTQTRMGRRVTISHDVRIEILKPVDVARLAEPLCPEPDVRFNSLFSCICPLKISC